MNTPLSRKQTGLKVFAFLLAFVLLHYAYDWTGSTFWAIFSGVSEGTYQHAKIGFYAYLLVSLLEYLVWRKQFPNRSRFIFSRLSATIFLPWLMFLTWYQAPALLGQPMPQEWIEVVYALFTTSLICIACTLLGRDLERLEFSRTMKVILVIFFIASIELFTIFTFNTPWAGFFTYP